MLRDRGVRTKLLAVLAIPTLLLVLVTGLLVGGQVSAARDASRVDALTDVAVQVNRVVHSLQEERSASLAYLQESTAGTQARMDGQRQFSNQQLRQLRRLLADSPIAAMSKELQVAVARAVQGHGELAGARRSVDAGRFFATETDVFYTKVIRADLDLPGVLAASSSTGVAQRLQAYEALSASIEYAAHERDLVETALLEGSLNEAEFAQISALIAQQRQGLSDFQRNAPAATYLALDNALASAENSQIDQVRRRLTDLLEGRGPNYGRSVEWVGAANSRIGPMTDTESALVADIAATATATQRDQEKRALSLVVAALVGLGLALLLAVALARRITRPLRRLTIAAGEIGEELPHMVERMQTPGEGPGVVVEPIPVESHDEIGALAEAFNSVNDVTVRVAKEQAALRASIAEMFVNVARRNQVLLGRQLSQLDAMEAREESPDVLDNLFKLDHLATRMRRNAESLLVLAGIDSTRRLRDEMPISDVIRAAVGEIESFDRIDLSMTEDPQVSGRHALTVAHLLAELFENATHFSNPETRVVVSAAVVRGGVDVTITDYGLGMSEDEIDAANERISNPPVAEIAVSQRLGLFVVARLAARLEASVVLRRGRTAGTVVAVSLPSSVFTDLRSVDTADAAGGQDASEAVVAAGVDVAEVPVAVGATDGSTAFGATDVVDGGDGADAFTLAEIDVRPEAFDLLPDERAGVDAVDFGGPEPMTEEWSLDDMAAEELAALPVDEVPVGEDPAEAVSESSEVDDSPFAAEPNLDAEPVIPELRQAEDAPARRFWSGWFDRKRRTLAVASDAEAEVAAAEPVDTEPVDTEPVDTEPVDTEPVDTEPVDAEPVDTEPVDTEPVDAEPVDTEPVDTEPVDAPAADSDVADPATVEVVLVEAGAVDDAADGSELVAPEPVTETAIEPLPPAFVLARAIDILPGGGKSRVGRFGRDRSRGPKRSAIAPADVAPVETGPAESASEWSALDAFEPRSEAEVTELAVTPPEVAETAPEHSESHADATADVAEPESLGSESLGSEEAEPQPVPVPSPVDLFGPAAPRASAEGDVPDGPPEQATVPAPAVARRPAPVPVAARLVDAAHQSEPVDPSNTVSEPPALARDIPAQSNLDRIAAQSRLHSSALSELRGLYAPAFVPTATTPEGDTAGATEDGGLARRTPKAAEPVREDASTAPARARTAADVRGMLSGFRAGVERGRAPETESTGHVNASQGTNRDRHGDHDTTDAAPSHPTEQPPQHS